ncbi:MAG: hypothetical protein LBE36_00340 [Flavobacteriaceae bacterium]|nr:hypothetical protein [Flavobacteriaceae bacterium]
MKKIISLFVVFSFLFSVISCNSNDRDIEPNPPYNPLSVNTFDLYIDGKKFEPNSYNINAHYLPCDRQISFTVVATVESQWIIIDLRINKQGKVKFFGIHQGDYDHYTTEYDPNKYLKITNLQLDAENEYMNVSFEGRIFKAYTDEPMEISGNFEIKYFSKSYCDATYDQLINLDDDIKFNNSDISRWTTSVQGQIINVKYEANEPDGRQFVLNGLKKNIYEMDLGTYEFDFSRENEFIEFNEYIGPPKSIFSTVLPTDWLKYDTSGSFTITKHELIDGHKVTKGTINLNTYENGVLIKSFQNAPFELSD